MNKKRIFQGFTLVESVIALGIFVIFVVGIYGSMQMTFSIIYQSRVRIIGTALLNEQIEIIRNAPFDKIGIVNGSPAGIFDYTVDVNRNGMTFEVTRTIRNVDDPYDGTIGGDPNDTAPADYKFVQIEVQCKVCNQKAPLSMYTYIGPKYLEGNVDHGALFVRVIDAYGNPVPEATVHIVATSTNPTYDFYDTTDVAGYLRVYDLASGNNAYMIDVSKEGFTTDTTRYPTPANPNPTMPQVSILPQAVSNLTLSIDHESSLTIHTKNIQCSEVGGTTVVAKGTRLIGTNPTVYLVNSSYATNSSGSTGELSLPWDSYGLTVSGYDLIGTIPHVPVALLPGSEQTSELIIGPNTSRSLIVMATYQDAPIANAKVTVTGPNGFQVIKDTGVGSFTQNDWSLGPNYQTYTDDRGYTASTGIDPYSSPGEIMLSSSGGAYVSSGYLESSTIDLGAGAEYVIWSWDPFTFSPSTTVKFQLATSSSSTPTSWNFVGPDGTEQTFFTTSSITIPDTHNDERYMRYRVYMETIDPAVSPILSSLTLVYTNTCTPPGQIYAGGLVEGDYSIKIEAAGYQTYTEPLHITGDHFIIVGLTSL